MSGFGSRLVRPALAGFVLAAVAGLPLLANAFTGFSYSVPLQPEIASGYTDKPGWATERFAVAGANPLATDAGFQVLKAGGSALDAAVAMQMVLTLVEPQSSGIGGGAFLLYFDGDEVSAYDGRERAPMAATETLFIDDDGKPLAFLDAAASGLSVGVPGVLRMLEMAHARYGKLPWAALFVPAITLAEEGFAVSARLHALLEADPALRNDARAAAFYYDAAGDPVPVGQRLKNPALAAIFRQLAAHGSDALHSGEMARNLVAAVRGHPQRPGVISAEDLAAYTALQRQPLCTDWRAYRVCGFPPPSSGHLSVMQILGMLAQLPPDPVAVEGLPMRLPMMLSDQAPSQAQLLPDLAALEGAATHRPAHGSALVDGIPGPVWLHHFTEAARLAFADRNRYIADPDFVAAPGGAWTTLLAPDYLRERAALISDTAMGRAQPGNPAPMQQRMGRQAEQPEYGTSHISIVDAAGHAVAMTTTVEAAFGARILVDGGTGLAGGYLLNNQLTDFSFQPRDDEGRPIANRVEPGKRPRSSMSPTLVFDRASGEFVASLGSPGGAAIIHYTARTLIAMLDWGLDAQQAIDLPHAVTLGGPTWLEAGRFPVSTIEALGRRGHEVIERDLTSGLQAIGRIPGGYFSGADPRREGVVMGE